MRGGGRTFKLINGTGAVIGDGLAWTGTGVTEEIDGITGEVDILGWLRSQYCPNQPANLSWTFSTNLDRNPQLTVWRQLVVDITGAGDGGARVEAGAGLMRLEAWAGLIREETGTGLARVEAGAGLTRVETVAGLARVETGAGLARV